MQLFNKLFSGGALLLFLILGAGLHDPATASSTNNNQPETIKVNDTGLSIRWQTPSEFVNGPVDSAAIPDSFSLDARPGYPQLPYRTATFTIPDGAKLEFSVELGNAAAYPFSSSIAIAPQPSGFETDDSGQIIGGSFAPAPAVEDVKIEHVVVEEIGRFAGYRLARAVYYPIAVENGQVILITDAIINIEFTDYAPQRSPQTALSALGASLESIVVNPTQAQKVQFTSRQPLAEPETAAAAVYIEQSGMVELTYSDWTGAGLAASALNPQTLQITHTGDTINYQWNGDSDALFETGESVIFYAPPFNSRWSETIPFLFSNDGSSQALMGTRSGANPSGSASANTRINTVVEQNLLYSSDCMCGNLPTGWDGDRWFWQELIRPGSEQATLPFELDQVSEADAAEMKLWLIGYTALTASPDHRLQVALNGSTLGTTTWDGKSLHAPTFTLPVGLLEASNSLEITLVDTGSSIDGVWLDAIELTYTRNGSTTSGQETLMGATSAQSYSLPVSGATSLSIYDVTDPMQPVRLTSLTRQSSSTSWSDDGRINTQYAIVPADDFLSPAQILPSNGLSAKAATVGTYVVIAPTEFINSGELDPLVNLRSSLGWNVVVEATEEIYIAFGGGVQNSPDAIKSYLEWAYGSWASQPEMLLLVGDGTNDPKQHRETTSVVRVPTYLVEADPWIGETAADNRYVAVDGDDFIPDISIGRLPVNSVEELAGVVSKIVQYETGSSFGNWNFQMTIVTDDNDAAGNFDDLSDGLINSYLQSPWLPEKVYLGSNNVDAETAQSQILSRWRGGQGMIMFTGHSSIHQWAAERLFHIDEVENLRNGSRLPIMLQMTCFTGSYHSSIFNTLDEQLVRQADGGAIAAWGATGLGVATGHDELAAGALNSLYKQNNPTLGVATMAGKVQLASEKPAFNDLLDTFNLLGDPALQVDLNENSGSPTIFLPLISR